MEAFKHGYAQRGFYGDPVDPVYRNISQITKYFIGKDIAKELAQRIVDVIIRLYRILLSRWITIAHSSRTLIIMGPCTSVF
jgi:hypothetical protein